MTRSRLAAILPVLVILDSASNPTWAVCAGYEMTNLVGNCEGSIEELTKGSLWAKLLSNAGEEIFSCHPLTDWINGRSY